MKKALNISIGKTLFYIEEDAYEKLSGYLKSIREHFTSYSDHDEIVLDIESRIAEQFSSKNKKIITIHDVQELITIMGEANQFDDALPTSELKKETPSTAQEKKESKRLFRNPDDEIIAGVSSGIAAYFGIDAVVVRILFFISLFFGGTGLILYIALWIAMPEARTATEKLQMRGNPVTLESVSELVKEKAHEVELNAKSGSLRRLLEIPRAIIRGIWLFFSRGVFPIIGKFLGVVLAFAALAAIIGLSITFFSILFNYPSENIDFPLGEVVSGPLFYLIVIAGYVVAIIPAAFFLLIGAGLLRNRSMLDSKFSVPVFIVWIIAIITLGVSGVRASALHAEFVRTDPSYQTETRSLSVSDFSQGIIAKNGQEIHLVQASTTSVTVEGRQRDLDRLHVNAQSGVLTIDRGENKKICIFCWSDHVTITISAPDFNKLTLEKGSRLETEGMLALGSFEAKIDNGSHAELKLNAAEKITFDVRNASRLSLEGSARETLVTVNNGSNATLIGESVNLSARISNGSRLDARGFITENVTVDADNGSRGDVYPKNSLTATAMNGSRIRFIETPREPVIERTENGSRVENITPSIPASTGTTTAPQASNDFEPEESEEVVY